MRNRRWGNFWPQRHTFINTCRGSLEDALHQSFKPLWFRTRTCKKLFPIGWHGNQGSVWNNSLNESAYPFWRKKPFSRQQVTFVAGTHSQLGELNHCVALSVFCLKIHIDRALAGFEPSIFQNKGNRLNHWAIKLNIFVRVLLVCIQQRIKSKWRKQSIEMTFKWIRHRHCYLKNMKALSSTVLT